MSCFIGDSMGDKVILTQFIGQGPEGDAVLQTLQRNHHLSDALTVRNSAPLRTCTTIVGADVATELVEPSGVINDEEMDALRRKVEELVAADRDEGGGKASCVCIMGSMPPGCEEATYADLTSRLAGRESLVLIDSVVGLDPLLGVLRNIFDDVPSKDDDGESGIGVGGAVLKLNAAELCKLAGVAKRSGGEADRVTIDELMSSTQGLIAKYANVVGSLDYLCITDGKYPGYLVEIPKTIPVSTSGENGGFRAWQMPAVDLSKQSTDGMLYPIGAGDTVAAGTLAAWQYLHHHYTTKGGEKDFFGVIPPSTVGKHLSNVQAEWSKGASSSEEVRGYKMATAFAFGLSCGSASCLQQDNSVFEVEDAVRFFLGMAKPVLQSS